MSDVSGPYDPSAIEGEKPSGHQYVSAKDLRVWGIAFVLLSVPFYFIYKVLEGNSERHRCTSNLGAIYKAINLYAEQHDNRFPPLVRTESDFVTPSLGENGTPYTWVSDVAPFMGTRQTFSCPTSTETERVLNESGESSSQTIASSYGMYVPYGGVLTSLVESPDQVVLIAETSDRGSQATVDPIPFGKSTPDGFAIGWSNSNTDPGKKADMVTRLAFPDAAKGPTKKGRHGAYLQALSASGELIQLGPDEAAFRTGGGVNPHWRLPPGYRPLGGG